jgi:hypothetical protein
MNLKRHPALRIALREIAAREPGRVDDDADAPARPAARGVTRGDLQHLFGDGPLLERVALEGRIGMRSVADTLDRTRIQFGPAAEQEWAHVTDRARLVAVDGLAMDLGTSFECANTVDVEDYAVLSELDALRAARAGRPAATKPTYDLVMIDEAQEFAPLELALIGRTLKPDASLVVAGDANQQTDDAAVFLGWAGVMEELGRPDHERVELEVGYRCAPPVASLARAILRPPASGVRAPSAPSVPLRAFGDDAKLADWLALGLSALQRRDRRASIGVVCRSPLTARKLVAGLHAREVPARIVFDGHFLLRGLQVTTVDQVKGLEFDFVVVPDASATTYPDDERARRALYVAVTRARYEVALACIGDLSPLVASAFRSP